MIDQPIHFFFADQLFYLSIKKCIAINFQSDSEGNCYFSSIKCLKISPADVYNIKNNEKEFKHYHQTIELNKLSFLPTLVNLTQNYAVVFFVLFFFAP